VNFETDKANEETFFNEILQAVLISSFVLSFIRPSDDFQSISWENSLLGQTTFFINSPKEEL